MDKSELMYSEYGYFESVKCEKCINYVTRMCGNRAIHKCLAFGDTRSHLSNWSGKNDACGLFGTLYDGKKPPMITKMKYKNNKGGGKRGKISKYKADRQHK